MSRCYRCKMELTGLNNSVEHILLNSLGGRLKSKNLLCVGCNNYYGNTIDAELFKRLHSLVSILGIDREKGTNPDIKNVISASGKKYHLEEGRSPILVAPEIEINTNSNTFYISARDERELLHMIRKLKKKHPRLDDKDVLQKAQRHREYMDEPVTIPLIIGGDDFNRAIIKKAINFYLYKERQITYLDNPIPMLDDDGDVCKSLLHHYYTDALTKSTNNRVLHSIMVSGNPERRLLFAYVELFSFCAFIVNLNSSYTGPAFQDEYHFDVLANQEFEREANILYLGPDSITEGLNHQYIEAIKFRLGRLVTIADKRQIDKTVN